MAMTEPAKPAHLFDRDLRKVGQTGDVRLIGLDQVYAG